MLLAALARAAGASVQDYDDLLPLIGGALGNISDEDLPSCAPAAGVVGQLRRRRRDVRRRRTLIEFGQGLGGEALSPALGGIDRSALFDKPRDLFIIIYLQPLPRRCAVDSAACLVDGRSPTDIFTETDAPGAAAWLKFAGPGIKPAQVVHVAIATSEGESLDAFRTRCGEVPGFPPHAVRRDGAVRRTRTSARSRLRSTPPTAAPGAWATSAS